MILLKEIVEALDITNDESSSFANRITGEVRTVTHEDLRYAEGDEDAPDLPDWQRDSVAQAREVVASENWLPLPSKFDIHEWDIMDDFARSLSDVGQRTTLMDAIRGGGAFRRFKTAIRQLRVEQSWFAYRAQALENIARSWLQEHDLEYR
jgi:hypothetical protein